MPQRLPLSFALGALGLLATALPSHAETAPARRQPAVPPLPVAQSQSITALPIALAPDTKPASVSPAPVSIQTLPPLADTTAEKREALAQGFKDIALAAPGLTIGLWSSVPLHLALSEAESEPDIVKPLEAIALNAPKPVALPITLSLSTIPDQSADDIAGFMPDIELKGISQETDLGYHASIAPFKAQEIETADAGAADKVAKTEEAATLTLPDVALKMNVTVALKFNAPLSLYVGPMAEEVAQAADALAPAKPRPRPHDLMASNEEHLTGAQPIATQGEPIFQLRR